jgi:hypothetical protein
VAAGEADAAGVAAGVIEAEAEADGVAAGVAGAVDALFVVDELRATTTSAIRTIATTTAKTRRLEDDFLAIGAFAAGCAGAFTGVDETTVVERDAEVGTGGTTKLDATDFLAADFFATAFLAVDFLATTFLAADFFATAFLAGAFLAADFFTAVFLTAAFLALFLTAAFLALFLTAAFFTAT